MSTHSKDRDSHDNGQVPGLLRSILEGTNPPLTAQFVYLLLRNLPRQVARYPRSAAFRNAAREYLSTRPDFYLEATRTDIETGLAFLDRNGLLPPWVVYRASHNDGAASQPRLGAMPDGNREAERPSI